MRSPSDFQYGSSTPSTDGLIRLARGWFDAAGKLIIPASAPTRAGSPDQAQYVTRSLPKVRSPTDFQYGGQNTSQPRTTTTVDLDGGTGLFDKLKDAAKDTLLTGLDDALDRARGGNGGPVAATPVSQPAPTVGGLPVGAIVAVGIVGGLLYMKFG